MNRLSVVLLSCAALCLPGIASAQSAKLEICNDGRLDLVVAVAARIQTFITGYKWTTRGWYTVAAGQCTVVYDEDYDEAGPYTPQSGARVAFMVNRSNGEMRVFRGGSGKKSGWMRAGTGQLCVNRTDAFTFERPSGDPAANCDAGILIPVANDFVPEGPGTFTYNTNWDGDDYYVSIGKEGQPRSSVAAASSADSVDNSLSAQFVRALAQAAKDANAKKAADADSVATREHGQAAMLEWVREDVTDYIEASQTGFQAYKSGEPQLSQGYRMWVSRVKPSLAQNCWVVQGAVSTTFSCVLAKQDIATARAYYTQITDDVTASLPPDWRPAGDAPFGGDLPGTSYRATSEAHGEVWLARAAAGSGYELHFQLVSAPTGPQPPKPADDDSIGEGGFITPPTPSNPPMR